jgi:serine/threonine-protein kinase
MEQIGRYKIVGELGRGAMGIVFKAQDPAIGRMIAIKSIRWGELTDESERERLRERLFREAQSAGILSHPNIVTIYDIADEGEMAYIFMEWVNGPSLEKMLKGEQAPDKGTLLSLLRQTALALDYAHKRGIVHRDVKPANIMVHEDGSAKITDFGIAKIISQNMTRAGTIMGTPSYMSPEQIQGTEITGRADQFSLAVIAYEILTGEKPFNAEYLPTLLFKIVREAPAPPHRLNSTLSVDIEPVLRKALSKDAAERYETCSDFVSALAAACANTLWVPLPRGASARTPTAGTDGKITARNVELYADTVAARPEEIISLSPRAAEAPIGSGIGKSIEDASVVELATAPPSTQQTSETSAPEQRATEESAAADVDDTKAPDSAPEAKPVVAAEPMISAARVVAAPKPVAAIEPDKVSKTPATSESPGIVLPAARVPRSRQEPPPRGHGLRNAFIGLIVALALATVVLYFMRGSLPVVGSWPGLTTSREASPPPVSGASPRQQKATTPPSPTDSARTAGTASENAAPAPATKSTASATPPAEAPATLMAFQLTTTPAGAQATVDGSPDLQCTSPCSLSLPLGRHTIQVHRDGFRDVQRVFNLPDDPGVIVALSPATGVVSISSTPPGLAIMVDGKEQARKTPSSLLLPVGAHKITIVKDGQKQEFTVDVREGVVVERSIDWAN